MRRIMQLLAAAATLAAPLAAPGTAPGTASCVAAPAATYRHTFDGNSGRATIIAVRDLCPGQTQSFALVAYTAGNPGGNAGQFTYSTDRATITSKTRSATLDVVVPPCHTQVDAIIGAGLLDEVTHSANPYGAKTLGAPGSRSAGPQAHYSGGSVDCSPAPEVAFTNACDGSYTATLTNGTTANVSATFLISGRLTRLAPGRSTTVEAPTGSSLTIRDNSFTTYVGSWRPPTTGCTAAPTQAPTAPAAVPTRPAPAPPSAPSAAAPATTAVTTATGDAPAAMFFPPTTTAAAETTSTRSGMTISSMLVVGFGLLLIVGGAFLLTRVLRTIRRP